MGTIYTGCNVENASFGLTICAERAAVAAAVTAGARRFRRIAIVVGSDAAGRCPAAPAARCSPSSGSIWPANPWARAPASPGTCAHLLPDAFGPGNLA